MAEKVSRLPDLFETSAAQSGVEMERIGSAFLPSCVECRFRVAKTEDRFMRGH
ncbi:MAG: hypothetical protein M3Z31_11980 [Pseudomonadota bacterium]|nr:hypothetical protein [Pseudomonadota bacterium]